MPSRKLRCAACECRFALEPDEEDLRRIRCPDCGEWVANRSTDDFDRPRSRSSRKSSGGKTALVILAVFGVLILGCCGGIGGLFWYAVGPTTYPEQTQDYSEARKSFKTTLVTKGAAPQTWDPLVTPPGVREIEYTSGGLKLKAWIQTPQPGAPAKPAVLFLHGGFAFGTEDWDQAKPFRDAGFVTMLPILRGENGLPGNYTMFYDEVDDVLAAAEVLARTPGVDPNRIYVAGHSAGGTLAMLAAMTSPKFKAAASFSGSPDQVLFAQGQDELVPFDPSNKREFEMRSPLAFYKCFKCPARLYYGNSEFAFKYSTNRLAEKAAAAGHDVKAISVPGDHMTSVDPAMRQAITFFQTK